MERNKLVVRLAAAADREARCRYVLSQAAKFLAADWTVIGADSPEKADLFFRYGTDDDLNPVPPPGPEPVVRVPCGSQDISSRPRSLATLSGVRGVREADSPAATDRVPILQASHCGEIRTGQPLYTYPDGSPAIGFSDRREIIFGYDFFGVVFSLLSCEREHLLERNGEGVDSLFRNLGEPAEVFASPIVNRNFLLLGRLLEEPNLGVSPGAGNRPSYPGGKKFAVCLTHDVDYLKKTALQRAKHFRHTAFRAVRAVRKGRWAEGGREAATLVSRCLGGGEYRRFREIRDLEARYGAVSTFNVYARPGGFSLRGLVRDPWYDVKTSGSLQTDLAEIAAGGGEIALHGSYDSYRDRELLTRERGELEKAAKTRIIGGRQHFLRLSVPETWIVQEQAGLRYDATFGFRDLAGFRNGAAFPFQPFDFECNRPIDLWEIPLVLMDGVLFDRDFSGESEVWPRAEEVLETLKECRGAASICWHQRVFCDRDFPGWGDLYERILRWIRDRDGWMGTCRDLVEHWENR